MDTHVDYLLYRCTHLLKLLIYIYIYIYRTQAIIVSRIINALPASGRFLSVELCNKINAVFRRLKRFRYFRYILLTSCYEMLTCLCVTHSIHCTIIIPQRVVYL